MTQSRSRIRLARGLAMLGLFAAGLVTAGEPIHLGVSTCGNSTCHGAPAPLPGSVVGQHEFTVWRDHDKHAKAYAALSSERGQAIARNLGLESAQTAPACLGCHSDNVPAALRGKSFRVEDGVGCETCHGGSANWLGPHAIGINSHADNLAAGLYPTDDPTARAKLCLGCHLFKGGDDYQHRYYAAGHPALHFELDTYTEERPGHHQIDADYLKRKPGSYGARAWTLGQVAAARKLVDRVADTAGRSPWPDLSTFACYGCHRTPGTTGIAQSSGLPVFQDAPLQMSLLALEALGLSADATAVRDGYQRFSQAMGHGSTAEWKSTGTALGAALAKAETALRARQVQGQTQDGRVLLQALMTRASSGALNRQHLAEQASYALATLRLSDKDLAARNANACNAALDELFAAAGQSASFDAARWTTAAQAFQQALAADAAAAR